MNTTCTYLPYNQTNAFSKITLDYLAADAKLQPFYQHPISIEGIQAAIEARKQFPTNRAVLVQELKNQYNGYELTAIQQQHLNDLLKPNAFTVTTAHQPNIFTGHLYFIYKILHAIKLAEKLKKQLPENNFVPVYYMGSEDADLRELGHIFIGGEKVAWSTEQKGAIGRMHTKGLEQITERLHGEFASLPFGEEMIALCRKAYEEHATVQEATLYLVNELFKDHGLLILIPDNAALKKLFEPVVAKELREQFSSKIVSDTVGRLGQQYKVQASGRDINLFYLNDAGRRERVETGISKTDGQKKYYVIPLSLTFTEDEIIKELHQHPERFSANVILRGVFQETILPNIAFIGGGGELAYWLELKDLFAALNVPYPVLILRNSFLLNEERATELMQKLGLSIEQLFLPEKDQFEMLVKANTTHRLQVDDEEKKIGAIYASMQEAAAAIDPTLQAHVAALHTRMLQHLHKLEAKMLRAEKRHHTDTQGQLKTVRRLTNPNNNLQERVDNFMPLYAKYGKKVIDVIYQHSRVLDGGFGVLKINERS